MKLVEKKCPNCGANLKFDKNDTEVTCKYCAASYEIKREENSIEGVLNPENFNLERKLVSRVIIFIFVISIIVLIIVLFAFLSFPRISIDNNIIINS